MEIKNKLYIVYNELFKREITKMVKKIADISTNDIPRESIILLQSTYDSINNSYKLLYGNNFIDSLSLLRCAFESILFSLAIELDSQLYLRYKSYNDDAFINYLKSKGKLELNEEKYRKLATPGNIRKIVSDNHKKIFKNFISDKRDSEAAKKELKTFYNYLCNFTHPSIIKTYAFKIQNDKESLENIKYIFKLNIVYCEMLLIHAIKYFLNDYSNIEDYYDLYLIIILLSANMVENIEELKKVLKKYEDYLYLNITRKHLNNNKSKEKMIENKLKELKDNPNVNELFIGLLGDVIKKFDAFDIWNKTFSE